MSYSEVGVLGGNGKRWEIDSAGSGNVNVVGGSVSIEATLEIRGESINATITNWVGESGQYVNVIGGSINTVTNVNGSSIGNKWFGASVTNWGGISGQWFNIVGGSVNTLADVNGSSIGNKWFGASVTNWEGISGQWVNIVGGSVSTLTTATITGGSINTLSTANITGGSINTLTTANITGGSINTLTTILGGSVAVLQNNVLSVFGCSTVEVGLTGMEILSANTDRRRFDIFNKGTSNVWIGNTQSVEAGVSMINFIPLAANTSYGLDNYTGNIYAIIGPGVSGDYQPLGIASFT